MPAKNGCAGKVTASCQRRANVPSSVSLYWLLAGGVAQTKGGFSQLQIWVKGKIKMKTSAIQPLSSRPLVISMCPLTWNTLYKELLTYFCACGCEVCV